MKTPATATEPVVFRVTLASADLGLEPGDDVVFDPSAPRLFTRLSPIDRDGLRRHSQAFGLQPLTPGPLPPGFTFAKRRPKREKGPKVEEPSRPPIQRGPLTLVKGQGG